MFANMKKAVVFVLFVLCMVSAKAFVVEIPVYDEVTKHGVHVYFTLYHKESNDSTLTSLFSRNAFDGVIILELPDRPKMHEYYISAYVLEENHDGAQKFCFSPNYKSSAYWISVPESAKHGYEAEPMLMRRKRTKELEEVTVTASKVMFYHKGDTLVYNADAFLLSEGSMLDALLRKLPGVELRDNGVIYSNGKRIDKLLLNGRDLFNGNKQIMLTNLAAYTVKNVAVYTERSRASELMNRDAGGHAEVMDVRLKREYMMGGMGSVEAGYGTEDRYLARLFGLWYSDNVGVTAFGGANNLSDNSSPDEKAEAWSTKKMSGGDFARHQGGLTYDAKGREDRWMMKGDVKAVRTATDVVSMTSRENVVSGANNPFEYSSRTQHNNDISLSTNHEFFSKLGKKAIVEVRPEFNYDIDRKKSGQASLALRSELTEWHDSGLINLEIPSDDIISLLFHDSSSKTKTIGGRVMANSDIKLRQYYNPSMLTVNLNAEVKSWHENASDYNRMDGGDVGSRESDITYRNRPNSTQNYSASVKFTQFYDPWQLRLPISYGFHYGEWRLNSEAFNRLSVTDEYLPQQSFNSRETEKTHTIAFLPARDKYIRINRHSEISLSLRVKVHFSERELGYDHGEETSTFKYHEIRPEIRLNVSYDYFDKSNKKTFHYLIADWESMEFRLSDLVGRPSTMLNSVFQGNPDLIRPSRFHFHYGWSAVRNYTKNFRLNFNYFKNQIENRSYVYDESAGIYYFKPENGRFRLYFNGEFEYFTPLDSKKRWLLKTVTKSVYNRVVNLTSKYGVFTATEKFNIEWIFGKHNLSAVANANYDNLRFSSEIRQTRSCGS